MRRTKRKIVLEHAQYADADMLRMRKDSSGHLLIIPTFCSSQCFVNGQWRLWSDCADAQSDLGIRCSHSSEDMFWHGATYIISSLTKFNL